MLFLHIKIKEHIANAQSSVKFINIILTEWAYPIYVSHLYVHFWPLSTVAFEFISCLFVVSGSQLKSENSTLSTSRCTFLMSNTIFV